MPWLISVRGSRIIVFPVTGEYLLPNIVTGYSSKLTTSRVSLEPKLHVYGNRLTFKVYKEFSRDDVAHYLVFLWTLYSTAKKLHDHRLTCKLLFEYVWFYEAVHGNMIEYTWRNILEKTSLSQLEGVLEYCIDILLHGHRARDTMWILKQVFNEMNTLSKKVLGVGLEGIVFNVDYLYRSAPRFREE